MRRRADIEGMSAGCFDALSWTFGEAEKRLDPRDVRVAALRVQRSAVASLWRDDTPLHVRLYGEAVIAHIRRYARSRWLTAAHLDKMRRHRARPNGRARGR